jgi:uncharacterized protein (TIGR02270 family)
LLELLAERRVDVGPLIGEHLRSADVAILRAALRAVRFCPDRSLHAHAVERLFDSTDQGVQITAAETGLLWGLRGAQSACARLAQTRNERALLLTALIGNEAEQLVIFEAAEDPESRMSALRAIGFIGTVSAADVALRFLADADKNVARLAGEAFAVITGRDLQDGAFAPNDDVAEDSDADAAVMGAMPFLDPVSARAWWKGARTAFVPGVRYLRGERTPQPDLGVPVMRLPMRLRAPILIALAIRKPGSRPVSTRSWTCNQTSQTRLLLEGPVRPSSA